MFLRKFVWATVICLCLCVSGQANADWFDDFNGGLQQTWSFGNLNGVNLPSGSFQAGSVNDTLLLTDPTVPQGGGAGIGFGGVNEIFTDVTVAGTLNPLGESNMNGFVGLLARADLNTLTGYVLTYSPVTGAVDLVRVVGGSQDGLDNVTIAQLDSSLYASLTVFGDQLTGRIFDAPGGTLLGEVSATDTVIASGISGVVVQIADGAVTTPIRGRWDNVSSITAIPEPSSVLVLGLIGIAAAYRRRSLSAGV